MYVFNCESKYYEVIVEMGARLDVQSPGKMQLMVLCFGVPVGSVFGPLRCGLRTVICVCCTKNGTLTNSNQQFIS